MKRIAIVGGVLAALVMIVAFLVKPVPDFLVSTLGGPAGGVDRVGGVRIRFRPPADGRADIEAILAARSTVKRDGDVLVLDFPHVDEDMIPELTAVLVGGGLSMHEVLESPFAGELARAVGLNLDAPRRRSEQSGPTLEADVWMPDEGGAKHEVLFLQAETLEELERVVATAKSQGLEPQPGAIIAYEYTEAWDTRRPMWRTYELRAQPEIDGNDIASAVVSYDPNTNRPIVLLDFTETGGEKFCELTRRIAGRKLATVLGDRIRSAPIINSAICGGRASITMGGTDPEQQNQEAAMTAAALSQGALPVGGTIADSRWVPPANVVLQEWLGRLLLGLVAGVGFGVLAFFVMRFVRPTWHSPPRVSGRFPLGRLILTLAAPIALLVGGSMIMPGVNDVELMHIIRGAPPTSFSLIALGVMPVLTAFTLVELVALAIPALRWRRHDPVGRLRLSQATAAVAIFVALAQSYFVAVYLESLARGGAMIVSDPGWQFRLLVMVTLTASTLLLAAFAGMISVHGLGNGYGVLLVAGWFLEVLHPVIGDEDSVAAAGVWLDRSRVLELAVAAAIAACTWCVLRWRVRGDDKQPALRLPNSSLTPLSDAGGLVFLIGLLSALGLGASLYGIMDRIAQLQANALLHFTLVVVFVPFWAWVLARPALLERVSMQAGMTRPSREMWLRATILSGALLAFVAALGWFASKFVGHITIANGAMVMIATAVVLDIVDDARAHREKLAAVGTLHQIQRAGIIEKLLADAGIRCHIHAQHIRALFAFFGPWAPAVILVPEANAGEARGKIDDAMREARATLPKASVQPNESATSHS